MSEWMNVGKIGLFALRIGGIVLWRNGAKHKAESLARRETTKLLILFYFFTN